MPWFVTKPRVFEAHQWTGPGCEIPGVQKKYVGDLSAYFYYVEYRHGVRRAVNPGDWVYPDPFVPGYYVAVPQVEFLAQFDPKVETPSIPDDPRDAVMRPAGPADRDGREFTMPANAMEHVVGPHPGG